METIKEKVEVKTKELDRKIKPWFFILGGGVLFIPFFLTQSWPGWIDFSSTGQIGDTIGGTLAPLVGLIGAILVYISFREQYKANISQWAALEEEMGIRKKDDNHKLLSQLVADIETKILNIDLQRLELNSKKRPQTFDKIPMIESEFSNATINLELILNEMSHFCLLLEGLTDQKKIEGLYITTFETKIIGYWNLLERVLVLIPERFKSSILRENEQHIKSVIDKMLP